MENNQQSDIDQAKYFDSAMRAVKEKKPLPEIDFTLHTMEDGTQVSTLDRVCKGTCLECACRAPLCRRVQNSTGELVLTSCDCRRSGARLPPTHPGSISLPPRSHQAEPPVPQTTFLPRRSPDRRASAMDHTERHRGAEVGAQPARNGRTHYRVR